MGSPFRRLSRSGRRSGATPIRVRRRPPAGLVAGPRDPPSGAAAGPPTSRDANGPAPSPSAAPLSTAVGRWKEFRDRSRAPIPAPQWRRHRSCGAAEEVPPSDGGRSGRRVGRIRVRRSRRSEAILGAPGACAVRKSRRCRRARERCRQGLARLGLEVSLSRWLYGVL